MNKSPTIDQYLLSTGLFIIDEFNEKYSETPKVDLKEIADTQFNEMDICVRLGYPFRQMVHYTYGDKKEHGLPKANHDLYVASKDFRIEVKFLKNWGSNSGRNHSASKKWIEYQKDFNWIINEIKNGHKGKSAFVIGWFNCVDHFSQLIQLGAGKSPGSKPLANQTKICYFPFLHREKIPTFTTDLTYDYSQSYEALNVSLIGDVREKLNCLFLGNPDDVFHLAIYF